MTNKQIINGVDVSGCQYNGGDLCSMSRGTYCFCTNKPNCIYKRLKRKEKECERLKEELSTYGATGICETCTEKSVLQNDKYAKALREIKEIAKKSYKTPLREKDCIECDGFLAQILQLISEVEDDRQS